MSRNLHFVSEHLETNSSQYNLTDASDGHAELPIVGLHTSALSARGYLDESQAREPLDLHADQNLAKSQVQGPNTKLVFGQKSERETQRS